MRKIALEIYKDWKRPHYTAVPYLNAMLSMESIDDLYVVGDGRSIVRGFLANAGTWRGETARRIKKELRDAL